MNAPEPIHTRPGQFVLTLNAGSSSLKVALYASGGDTPLVSGIADRIGGADGILKLKDGAGQPMPVHGAQLDSHESALAAVIDALRRDFPALALVAVGHRVVHGGARYAEPLVLDDAALEYLESLVPFAPLHQPHNLRGIRAAMAAFPGVPQVACFDTAFHRQHPWVNDAFALPRALYAEGVRRYGFHGLSYEYVSGALAQRAPGLSSGCVVVAHLGNGASMCAVQNGRSVASTMGFSALDGLPMGTRCGQLDPGVLLYLMDQKGMSAGHISDLLYKQSGLLGLSGVSNDMRTLEASPAPEAAEAIDYFVFRCQREVGAMAAAMGGIDALVFCGGIGENSRLIRQRICERLAWMGIELDHQRNAANAFVVSTETARTTVLVIPTNEELVIARAARAAALTAEANP
ncbi:acetate/propionate family kinase [Ottowia sp.]|uniref:acetate/propionate family kinase n=1 Tax=Ottowia sp. TaxID=1898956 RepID=UPI002B600B03|nr:acetate/propionate family kinase [Ottowia sp.]HOB66014.1 acetate/propionate family kinase [Ottowia sp.]HPZ56124.1 acetate/propionate family kinase [Ottowia sp.]HQD46738.1 acetate/propionate family kinase [Ottowia sp.]